MEPNKPHAPSATPPELPQRQVFRGATLIIAGIALGYVAQRNKPVGGYQPGAQVEHGFSHTVYDLLRVGIWALWIFGILLIVMGLIQYRAQTRRLDPPGAT